MRFDTVLFDFDGVLVESARIKTDAFRVIYAGQPPDVLARIVAYHKANAGISRVVKIRHVEREFLGRPGDDGTVAALSARYSDAVVGKVVAAPPVAGADDFLARFKGRLRMFVISGTPEAELVSIVAARGLGDTFTAVRGSPALKPDIGRDLAARYGLDMARTVFVGDATTDFDAAHDLGCAFVGRVPPGERGPFPAGTVILPDLTGLAALM